VAAARGLLARSLDLVAAHRATLEASAVSDGEASVSRAAVCALFGASQACRLLVALRPAAAALAFAAAHHRGDTRGGGGRGSSGGGDVFPPGGPAEGASGAQLLAEWDGALAAGVEAVRTALHRHRGFSLNEPLGLACAGNHWFLQRAQASRVQHISVEI